jgi:hypothetical protein
MVRADRYGLGIRLDRYLRHGATQRLPAATETASMRIPFISGRVWLEATHVEIGLRGRRIAQRERAPSVPE